MDDRISRAPHGKPCTFYVARHGETEWNVRHIVQGHLDSALTERGKEQARDLARSLHDVHFDAVFSSDLGRAVTTAEIVASQYSLPVQTSPELREKLFGRFQGGAGDDLMDAYPNWESLTDEERHHQKLDGETESNAEVAERVMNCLRAIAQEFPGKTVLVVTHGGVIRYLLIRLGVGTYSTIRRIPNASYVVVIGDGEHLRVKSMVDVELDT